MVSTRDPHERPSSVTVISVMLALLAAADLGSAVVWSRSEVIAAAARNGLVVGGWAHASSLVIGAAAALVSSVGLWRMAAWARSGFLGWCLTVISFDISAIRSGLSGMTGTASAGTLLGAIYWKPVRPRSAPLRGPRRGGPLMKWFHVEQV